PVRSAKNEEARLVRAFLFAFPVAPAGGRVTAERRKLPARFSAGRAGMRVRKGMQTSPARLPENEEPASRGLLHVWRRLCPQAGRNHRSSRVEPLREIRDCIRTRLRYRGGMRS
ncbi:hypothetical protein, partial [Burkholderia cepacia]|uniref:hypothetical protein n=1 Tax=Burkholderia cepacia TaxID=292 RepID=UPI002AB2A76D